MNKVLLIALGGALGTLARYGTTVLAATLAERWAFPIGTLAVNLLGCFAIGYLGGAFDRSAVREEYRLMVIAGFLGGFTTFSSFGWETMRMVRDGQVGRGVVYVLASNIVGIALAFGGYGVARWRG